jgi:hypothetical protein
MRPATIFARRTEPPKLIAVRPDGSTMWGQWQYQYQPGNSADEGWVYETWVEPPTQQETKS